MKERPILFSGPMVRALLDGSKTQTRRIVKAKHVQWLDNSVLNFLDGKWNQRPLPYGLPGDHLWVRETFQGPLWDEGTWDPDTDYHKPQFCEYRADGGPMPEYVDFEDNLHQGWKPSIHMPRWASRITLEVTGVRVERLQDISDADALAEGIRQTNQGFEVESGTHFHAASARRSFLSLWDHLATPGADSDSNPWVWVIEFKRVTSEA